MRKTIIKSAIALAALFGLSSCNFDMVDNYTFSEQVSTNVTDENRAKALESYFRTVVDFDSEETFYGSQYEASVYGQSLIKKTMDEIDGDYVASLLVEDEAVQYLMWMIGKKTKMVIGQVTWTPAGESDGENPEATTGTSLSVQIVE